MDNIRPKVESLRKEYRNMKYIKHWIYKIFKIDILTKDYLELCQKYETTNALKESYRRQVKELEEIYANPISYVENALKESREAYEKCVIDMEELLAKQDRLEHKAYARGRSDAYAEMGIKALDARLNGETLYIDENDNVITVENVDVFDGESFEEFCAKENLDPNEFEDVEVR
jgi:hypothetical protein